MNVLLTGATGYIGRRLKERLLGDTNVRLRLFVRNADKVRASTRGKADVFEGSTFDTSSLRRALQGIDTAYYLIHSMGAKGNFEDLDRLSAKNFLEACIAARVKRIIYLGGLGRKETASRHLLSRLETGEILSRRPEDIQTIWFRAGIIIGSGSASFEIIRNLVQKLPLIITPRWVRTRTQPIAVRDVLDYLFQAKDIETKENLVVDIGSEQMSFRDMLERAARVMGLRRRLIPVPVLSPKMSSYWLIMVTPVSYRIAQALVEGLKSETVIQNDNAAKYFPDVSPLSYEKALEAALAEIESSQVVSRWCDSSAGEVCDIKGLDRIDKAVLADRRVFSFEDIRAENAFDSILSLGGETGWLKYNWLWKLRGFMDKLVGGPGLNRGRRDRDELRPGDSLDFWKVVDVRRGKRLLLLSQMKLPGKAWLEFSIQDRSLALTASFLPRGLAGRLYWTLVKPFHSIAFKGLAKGILDKAQKKE